MRKSAMALSVACLLLATEAAAQSVPVFDPTISIGNIITIVVVVGGVIAAWTRLGSNITGVMTNMQATIAEIGDIKVDVKEIGKVLVDVARQDERLNAMDERMLTQGRRIDLNQAAIARLEGGRTDETVDRFNRLMTTLEKG